MMFLIQRDGEQNIVSQIDLEYQMKNGWDVVKPLPDCPNAIKTMRYMERSPKQIIEWYKFKIEIAKTQMEDWQKQLKKFKEMVE
jgi:queuine/archaeosine tRNA-ribosyltransferase